MSINKKVQLVDDDIKLFPISAPFFPDPNNIIARLDYTSINTYTAIEDCILIINGGSGYSNFTKYGNCGLTINNNSATGIIVIPLKKGQSMTFGSTYNTVHVPTVVFGIIR